MKYDIIVVGGGHAGIEAAYIASKKKLKILLITGNIDLIGQMSCNPSIGGVSKGNLVREIDALGGIMAELIDSTGIHFKMLNRSKGIAVWGNRAQADKDHYRVAARQALEKRENIRILQGYVTAIKCSKRKIVGVVLDSGETIEANAVILAMGTFLNGTVHIGLHSFPSGRIGEPPAEKLTESINRFGIKSGRLKTGTPPRLDGRTIDFKRFKIQKGDDQPWPFSFSNGSVLKNKVCCYIGKTNARTHEIIMNSLDRSPLYTGKIHSIGPKYCPSIEDKLVRFGEREGHTLFLEPESISFHEVYVNGISTSLPFDVQKRIVESIEGLEKTEIIRPGYGIEYDYFQPLQLKNTLESKIIDNLYFSGQINGTSGYEEAAAQGLIAGINAAQKLLHQEELVLGRHTSYIGVLIDDLVTKGTEEPYRMFTSRAEYRLLLRQDNSDERLMPLSYRMGFLDEKKYRIREKFWGKKEKLKNELKEKKITAYSKGKKEKRDCYTLLKRPEYTFDFLMEEYKCIFSDNEELKFSVEADIKYSGFEKKENKRIQTLSRIEKTKIPESINYIEINGLLLESRKKLEKIKPETLGKASRIAGITPSDISTLAIYISNYHQSVSRETTERFL